MYIFAKRAGMDCFYAIKECDVDEMIHFLVTIEPVNDSDVQNFYSNAYPELKVQLFNGTIANIPQGRLLAEGLLKEWIKLKREFISDLAKTIMEAVKENGEYKIYDYEFKTGEL